MTGQLDLDLLEELDDQNAFGLNSGTRKQGARRRGFVQSISPQFQRAKVARAPKDAPPAPDSPAASPSPPEAVPDPVQPTVSPRLVRTKLELVAALRATKEFRDLSHEALDGLIGWADRYSSKALAPIPKKRLSGDTLQLVLDALGLGIAAVVIVEDPDQTAKMRPRWTPRSQFGPRPNCGALLLDDPQAMLSTTTEDEHVETPHQLPPKA